MSISAAGVGVSVALPIAKKLLKFAKSKLSKKVLDSPLVEIAADTLIEEVSKKLDVSPQDIDARANDPLPDEWIDVVDEVVEDNFDLWFQTMQIQISETNETMRQEALGEDLWTRRWRPFFGFVFSGVYGLFALTVAYAVVAAASPFTALVQLSGLVMTLVTSGAACLGTYIYQRSKRDKVG